MRSLLHYDQPCTCPRKVFSKEIPEAPVALLWHAGWASNLYAACMTANVAVHGNKRNRNEAYDE